MHIIVIIPSTITLSSQTTTTKSFSATTSNIYNKLSSNTFHTIPSFINNSNNNESSDSGGFPIIFQQQQQIDVIPSIPTISITLITSTESTRKLWVDKINETRINNNM
jgi:hypothetical protein